MHGRMLLLFGATLLISSAVSACGDDVVGVRGSGDLITESRQVSGFDEIVVLGSGDVVVEVTGTESLEIEAEDNIMPLLTAEVRSGRLELGSDSSFSTTRGITYTITAAELVGVTVSGSGNVNGSRIDTDSFEVAIAGSGRVDLAGTSDDLMVEISGSGDFGGEDLESARGAVTVAGSGGALVNVRGDLTVKISGSGNVEYLGSPTVTQDISGSGSLSRR